MHKLITNELEHATGVAAVSGLVDAQNDQYVVAPPAPLFCLLACCAERHSQLERRATGITGLRRHGLISQLERGTGPQRYG